MASSADDWSTQSNDALHISLVRPENGTSKTISTFHPKFTYSIFGDEESIFGYQGLKIHLRYNASDMRPGVLITYNKRFKAVGDVEPTDLKGLLEDFLPESAFQKAAAFDAAINDPNLKSFTPPGKLLKSHEEGDSTYEIWYGNSADPAIQQLLRRLQILVSLFIEGGTAIDDAEWGSGRWTVFLLYKKGPATDDASPYTFMGYCTVYQYYPIIPKLPLPAPGTRRKAISLPVNSSVTIPFPDQSLSDLPIRSRISQFIVLPPFQGSGHGARLYSAVFAHLQSDPQTVEITVEDPNEAFDDLRDLNDLKYLRSLPEFQALEINRAADIIRKGRVPSDDIIDQSTLTELRKKVKIAPRQFQRLVEMQLLSAIPTNIRKSLAVEQQPVPNTLGAKLKQHEYRLWGLLVKQRLYKHNKDNLIQLDRGERIDKLEEAAGNVELDYARLLRKLDGGGDEDVVVKKGETLEVPEASVSRSTTPGKRAAESAELDLSVRQSKKVRIEEEAEE